MHADLSIAKHDRSQADTSHGETLGERLTVAEEEESNLPRSRPGLASDGSTAIRGDR